MNELDGVLHIERKFPFLFTAAPHCTTAVHTLTLHALRKVITSSHYLYMHMYKINKIHVGTLVVSLVFGVFVQAKCKIVRI